MQSGGDMTGRGGMMLVHALKEYKESWLRPTSEKMLPKCDVNSIYGCWHLITLTRQGDTVEWGLLAEGSPYWGWEAKEKCWIWDLETRLGKMLRKEKDMCAMSREPQPFVLEGEGDKEIGVMWSWGWAGFPDQWHSGCLQLTAMPCWAKGVWIGGWVFCFCFIIASSKKLRVFPEQKQKWQNSIVGFSS